MKKSLFCFFLLSSFYTYAVSSKLEVYLKEREEALVLNQAFSFDSKLFLSPQEKQVNDYLENLKNKLIASYRKKGTIPFSQNFLLNKNTVFENDLFLFIKKMPKGSLLHVHSGAFLKSEWIIKELTTLPDCYVYWLDDGVFLKGTFHFYEKNAVPHGFVSVSNLRANSPDFDKILLSLLEMEKKESSSSNLWEKFENWFQRIGGLIHYTPGFIKYYKYAMETLIEDNLQYMEVRALNIPVYNLDGSIEPPEKNIELYLQVRKEIQKKHPYFDFKIIHTEFRNLSQDQALQKLEFAYFLRSLYPSFVIGYDLVGEESLEQSTLRFVDVFLEGQTVFEKKYKVDLPYYFHNGESSWAYNKNLFDTVLLKSKRIGHALNLFNFPYLMEKIKQQDICIEVCPISNQVLGYVPDLRMHPASGYLKAGIPCVISSDDSGMFGYHGTSPDLWEAVLAWDLDLTSLKQLFINSIQYSGMSKEEKALAFEHWSKQWNVFIEESLKAIL